MRKIELDPSTTIIIEEQHEQSNHSARVRFITTTNCLDIKTKPYVEECQLKDAIDVIVDQLKQEYEDRNNDRR